MAEPARTTAATVAATKSLFSKATASLLAKGNESGSRSLFCMALEMSTDSLV
jgi:hypothetical protein